MVPATCVADGVADAAVAAVGAAAATPDGAPKNLYLNFQFFYKKSIILILADVEFRCCPNCCSSRKVMQQVCSVKGVLAIHANYGVGVV